MFSLAWILPREDKFHRLLEALSAAAQEGAAQLKKLVESRNDTDREAAAAGIHACKVKAKDLSADVTRELCVTFITPFDREDIQDFASNIYKVIKTIDKACEYVAQHGLDPAVDLAQQADVIVREAEAMQGMMQALIGGGKTELIMKQAELLDALEHEGDEVRGRLMVELFKGTQDARQLILKKDLYDLLERVIDRYRNAAEVALQMALKHA